MPKRKKRKPTKKLLSLRTKTLFILGFFLVVIPVSYYFNETIQLAFFTPKVPVVVSKFAPPTNIVITSINLDLPIVEEAILNGAWQIAENGISHLNTSARPLEKGPIILYGHNTDNRFGPIRWLKKNSIIILKTSDGKTHIYKVLKIEDVSSFQVNLLNNIKDETLILYTCDGFADLQRFLVFATPVR